MPGTVTEMAGDAMEMTGKIPEITGKTAEITGQAAAAGTGADKLTSSAPALVDETSNGDIDLGRGGLVLQLIFIDNIAIKENILYCTYVFLAL
jgi:hypothetical protein